jgi:hypothetical protein
MRQGMTKNSAGIGGKIEELDKDGFCNMTGGDRFRRRVQRDYKKTGPSDLSLREAIGVLTGEIQEDVSAPKREGTFGTALRG